MTSRQALLSTNETDDAYVAVVAKLSDRWRVMRPVRGWTIMLI